MTIPLQQIFFAIIGIIIAVILLKIGTAIYYLLQKENKEKPKRKDYAIGRGKEI